MRKFYHNITKGELNVTDFGDFVDVYTDGDIVLRTESGNAIVERLKDEEVLALINDHASNQEEE